MLWCDGWDDPHAGDVSGSAEMQLARRRVATVLIAGGWTIAADGLRIWHDLDDHGTGMIAAADGLDRLGIEHTLSMAVPPNGSRTTLADSRAGVEIHIAPDQYDRLAHWFPSLGGSLEDVTPRYSRPETA